LESGKCNIEPTTMEGDENGIVQVTIGSKEDIYVVTSIKKQDYFEELS
jgi:hypothetical protein